jgi:hypothetical protein
LTALILLGTEIWSKMEARNEICFNLKGIYTVRYGVFCSSIETGYRLEEEISAGYRGIHQSRQLHDPGPPDSLASNTSTLDGNER